MPCAEHSLDGLKKNLDAEYAMEEVVLNRGYKVFIMQCLVLLVFIHKAAIRWWNTDLQILRPRGTEGSFSDRTEMETIFGCN